MGFTDIVMIADSGGNVNGMKEAVTALNAKWQGTRARAYYIDEYYEEDKWSYDFLKSIGINQVPDVQSATRYDIHDDYHYEALVALIDPKLIRAEQRIKAKKFIINGVEIGIGREDAREREEDPGSPRDDHGQRHSQGDRRAALDAAVAPSEVR